MDPLWRRALIERERERLAVLDEKNKPVELVKRADVVAASTAIVAEELAKLKAAAKEEKPTEPPARDAEAMKRAAKKAR